MDYFPAAGADQWTGLGDRQQPNDDSDELCPAISEDCSHYDPPTVQSDLSHVQRFTPSLQWRGEKASVTFT